MKKEEIIEVLTNGLTPEPKRFCKGCLADVTHSMFCSCGEFPLLESETYSEADLVDRDKMQIGNLITNKMKTTKEKIQELLNSNKDCYTENIELCIKLLAEKLDNLSFEVKTIHELKIEKVGHSNTIL